MKSTLGERRVRTDFNVAEGATKSNIDVIKDKSAELINLCEEFRIEEGGGNDLSEKNRLLDIAEQKYEEAAMWAVKAATA